jgi:hypothetical protein
LGDFAIFYGNFRNNSVQCPNADDVLFKTHHHQCYSHPEEFVGIECNVFENPKPKTMALSVLVVIEVLNAFNR